MSLAKPRFQRLCFLASIFVFISGIFLLASLRPSGFCDLVSCHTLDDFGERFRTFRWKHGDDGDDQSEADPNGDSSDEDRIVPYRPIDPSCHNFPNTSNILLVMKTGASEASKKVPMQLMSNLKCIPEFLIFSDLEQEIVGFPVHDSLDEVLPETKKNNGDFDLYQRQKQCLIDIDSCNKGYDFASQAWGLDKYKNIHIAEKAWRLRPEYDWYLYTDADTYVMWATMTEWLKRFDPNKRHYIGSVAYVANFPFAHGGSGYLVSRGSMKALFDRSTNSSNITDVGSSMGVANKWEEETRHWCCGDAVFSKALNNETGINVKNAWPTINGEKPHTLGYGPRQWCHPITTMHHVGVQDVSDLDAFEKAANSQNITRIKDFYHYFFEPHLVPWRQDWDNLSDNEWYLDVNATHEDWQIAKAKTENLSPLQEVAYVNPEACEKACDSIDDCFQWRFHKGICAIDRSFHHGNPVKVHGNPQIRMTSGWNMDRIQKWVAGNDACDGVDWPDIKDE